MDNRRGSVTAGSALQTVKARDSRAVIAASAEPNAATGNLPLEIEEDLAETVGHMIKRGMLPRCELGKILSMIASEVGLEPPYIKIVSDPKWMRSFLERWAHKMCETHTTCSTSTTVTSQVIQARNATTRNEVPSSSPRQPVKKNQKAILGSMSSGQISLAALPTSSQKSELTSYLNAAKHPVMPAHVKILREVNSPGKSKQLSPENIPTEAELLDEVKRVSMGLRGTIKPVVRLQYPVEISPKKKILKDRIVDRSEIVTSDSRSDGESSLLSDDDSLTVRRKWKVSKRSPWSAKIPAHVQLSRSKAKVVIARKRDNMTEIIELTDSGEDSDLTSIPKQVPGNLKRKNGHHSKGLRDIIKPVERFQSAPKFQDQAKKRKHRDDAYLQIISSYEATSSSSDDETSASTSSRKRRSRYAEDEDKGRNNFQLVHAGIMKLKDLCLACGTTKNIKANHPLFIGGLCEEHKLMLHEWFFKYDSDGYHSCCSVCCMGDKVVLCDIQDCGRCYCKECLDTLVGRGCFDDAVRLERWVCYFCKDSAESLLRRRPEWQKEIQRLYQNTCESQYPQFPVPQPIPVQDRRPIRVLSLFDGIATGVVALKQLGLEIGKFVASEIDEDAIRLVQNKHPEVIHIGDITKVTDEQIYQMGPFDLLLGGSPCNDLSGANPKRRGLIDAEGSGCLFFDFYRILRTVEPPRDGSQLRRPFFWLFENVVSMKGIEKERISRFLQCEPKMADARYVSAAARPRLFWGNLPGLRDRHITPGVKDRLTVQDCLESGREAMVKKLNTITTKYTCLYQGQTRQAPVVHNGKDDVLWTTELERVFGVPEHYTDVNNLGPRERLALLGRSWSVPVIRLLLAPLKEYFSGVQQQLAKQKLSSASWWS